jgi:2-polyprenyl-6-methoxyphenol hydroxylase-like FAD-dependent oxidoreductase
LNTNYSPAPADVRFSTTLSDFRQDDAAVCTTVVGPDGRSQTVRARYLIAADGASSPIRQALGIEMLGPAALGHAVNIYFRADLTPWVAGRLCAGFFFADPALVRHALLAVDGSDRWLAIAPYHPPADKPEDFTDARCVGIIRWLVGVPDLRVEVINTAFWTLSAQVAAHFRHGQRLSTLDLFDRTFVLLAGPAGAAWCHAAAAVSAALRVPLDSYVLGPGGDLDDPEGDSCAPMGWPSMVRCCSGRTAMSRGASPPLRTTPKVHLRPQWQR